MSDKSHANSVIDVLSVFPDVVRTVLDSSILRRAQSSGLITLENSDLRQFAGDHKYRAVDDNPFGGKQGMLFRAEVLDLAMQAQLEKVAGQRENLMVLYTSPRGLRWEQPAAERLSRWVLERPGRRLVVAAGRYEGVDERFVEQWVDMEVSLGDFILSGGELAALSVVDSVVRLLPGALGHADSAREDSFTTGLLEYPQYTKPREFKGQGVPEELYSGNHKKIAQWQLRQSLLYTFAFRPDLIEMHNGEGLPDWATELLRHLKQRLDHRS